MNIVSKLLTLVKIHQKDIFLSFCMILIALIGYNFGKINALKKTPLTIKPDRNQADIYGAVSDQNLTIPKNTQTQTIDRRVVVSKNSDKYHFTWCSGAKRIKEGNKMWFENEAAAQTAGYTKAGNCN